MDFVTFTEEILNGKLHFLYSDTCFSITLYNVNFACKLFQVAGPDLVYSEFVKQTLESASIDKLAMKVLLETECFHINGEKKFKSKSYFWYWLLGFCIYLFYGSSILCNSFSVIAALKK